MSSCPQEPEQEARQPPEARGARHERATAVWLLRALRRTTGLGGGGGGHRALLWSSGNALETNTKHCGCTILGRYQMLLDYTP